MVLIMSHSPLTRKGTTMKTSEKAKDIMKGMESLALKPYDDQKGIQSAPIKFWVKGATIGWGHLITQPEWNSYRWGITKDQADALFDKDITPFEIAVDRMVRRSLKQYEFDALVMLCFNIGVGNFSTSSVLKMVNGEKGNYSTLQAAWSAFNKSQGKVMNGLTKRRKLEYDLYSSGVYQYFK